MLRESAFDIHAAESDLCGGRGRRIEVSWRIFVVQIFMISFGIGPFFAFGTESVRSAIRRVSKFSAKFIGTYVIVAFGHLRAYARRVLHRPVNPGPVKGTPTVRATDRMSTFSTDANSFAPSTLYGEGEVKSPMGSDASQRPARPRAETDVCSDVLSGDIRLSDFMHGGMVFEEEDDFQ